MGDEVNYASVVFKNPQVSRPPAKKEEETIYDEVKTQANVIDPTRPDASDGKPAKDSLVLRVVALCLGVLCVLLASAGIALYAHMTEAISREQNTKLESDLRDNQTALLAANHNLTTQNYELRAEKTNLETNIQIMTTQRADLKVAIFQFDNFPVNVYCPKQENDQERVCKPCQNGWEHFQSSCYVSHNPVSNRKTWKDAQDYCIKKDSSLVVIGSPEEQAFVYTISYGANTWRDNGYWMGLKKTDGRWGWTDGSNLTEGYWYWVSDPISSAGCAVSFQFNETHLGLKATGCRRKMLWICEMKAVVLV